MSKQRDPDRHAGVPQRLRLLRAAVVISVLVPVFCGPAAAQDAPPKLTGRYKCTGIDDRQNKYAIALEVRARDEGFLLLWTHPNGRVSARGLGLRDESKLVVSFTDGRAMGVAHYAITPGVLNGRWWAGGGAVLSETCSQVEAKQARRPLGRELPSRNPF